MDYLREIADAVRSLLHDYASFIGMMFIAAYGGIVSYLKTVKTKGAAMRYSEMLLEALASAFVGLLIGMLVLSVVDNQMVAMAAAGYAGHEGTRKIFRLINATIRDKMK